MNRAVTELNILICGVGGQGNLLASEIIASAAVKEGFSLRVADIFGAAQRGGAVASHIRIGKDVHSPVLPQNSAHILLGFEPAECLRVANFLRPDCMAIMNTRPIIPSTVSLGKARYPSRDEIEGLLQKLVKTIITLDAVQLAQKAGDPMMMNIVMVGALAGTDGTPIQKDSFIEAIKELVPKGTQEKNLDAFNLGYRDVSKKIAK